MKKIVSFLIALCLLLSFSLSTFASMPSWHKEGTSEDHTWYGLNNTEAILPNGARLPLWLIEPDSEDYEKFYSRLTEEQQEKLDAGKGRIFLFSGEDLKKYPEIEKKLGDPKLYVELGGDWDDDDIHAIFIDEDEEENLPFEFPSPQLPEEEKFARLNLSHFSTFSQGSLPVILITAAAAILLTVFLVRKKKK